MTRCVGMGGKYRMPLPHLHFPRKGGLAVNTHACSHSTTPPHIYTCTDTSRLTLPSALASHTLPPLLEPPYLCFVRSYGLAFHVCVGFSRHCHVSVTVRVFAGQLYSVTGCLRSSGTEKLAGKDTWKKGSGEYGFATKNACSHVTHTKHS